MFAVKRLGAYIHGGDHVLSKMEEIYQDSGQKIYNVGLEAEGKAKRYVEEITATSVAKETDRRFPSTPQKRWRKLTR